MALALALTLSHTLALALTLTLAHTHTQSHSHSHTLSHTRTHIHTQPYTHTHPLGGAPPLVRRERPKLLLGPDGKPQWLYNGVCVNETGRGERQCFTFGQRVMGLSF